WVADEVGEAFVHHTFLRGAQVENVCAVAGNLASVALASLALNLPIWLGGAALIVMAAGLLAVMPETRFDRADYAERSVAQAELTALAEMRRTLGEGVRAVRTGTAVLTVLVISVFHGATSEGFDRLWEAHFL